MKAPLFAAMCAALVAFAAMPSPAAAQAPGKTAKEAAPAPSQAPASTAAPTPAPAVPAARTSAPTGAGQFRSEAEAKGHCPADTVVWVNEKSHVYHFAGTHNYGTTKQGAYMCERDATAQGNRAAKNEKHP